METSNVLIAFGLTLFAGLSTGIGSLIALLSKTTNTKFLSYALGFSAGVMIYISFVEIFPESIHMLETNYGETFSNWVAVIAFFGGMLAIALIDKLVPNSKNPHEVHLVEEMNEERAKEEKNNKRLMRMGIFTAIAITIHNFPEGIAAFTAALNDVSLGIPIAIAIAIHNIPEGIAVAVPIYFATKSRRKAFKFSFLSGLAEPLGALLAFLILMPFLETCACLMGIIFAAVAGIMVFISLDELLPASEEYGEHHVAIYGIVSGMGIMAVSLLVL